MPLRNIRTAIADHTLAFRLFAGATTSIGFNRRSIRRRTEIDRQDRVAFWLSFLITILSRSHLSILDDLNGTPNFYQAAGRAVAVVTSVAALQRCDITSRRIYGMAESHPLTLIKTLSPRAKSRDQLFLIPDSASPSFQISKCEWSVGPWRGSATKIAATVDKIPRSRIIMFLCPTTKKLSTWPWKLCFAPYIRTSTPPTIIARSVARLNLPDRMQARLWREPTHQPAGLVTAIPNALSAAIKTLNQNIQSVDTSLWPVGGCVSPEVASPAARASICQPLSNQSDVLRTALRSRDEWLQPNSVNEEVCDYLMSVARRTRRSLRQNYIVQAPTAFGKRLNRGNRRLARSGMSFFCNSDGNIDGGFFSTASAYPRPDGTGSSEPVLPGVF